MVEWKGGFFLFVSFCLFSSFLNNSQKNKKTKNAKKKPFAFQRDDDEGFVTFTTWFKVTGQQGSRQDGGDAVGTMSERSLFVRVPDDGGDGDGGGKEGEEEEGDRKKRGRWLDREGTPVINGVPRILS